MKIQTGEGRVDRASALAGAGWVGKSRIKSKSEGPDCAKEGEVKSGGVYSQTHRSEPATECQMGGGCWTAVLL